jgi:hypothetical protein
MVIETDLSYNSGSFIVKKYTIDDVLTARTNWEQWTDAIYNRKIPLTVKQSLIFTAGCLMKRMKNRYCCIRLNSMILFLFDYSNLKDFVY